MSRMVYQPMKNHLKYKTFTFLYHLHIYSGLFCAVYLFIAGFSALNIQHKFISSLPTDTIAYTRIIPFDRTLKADSLARYITHRLEISGYTPPWDFRQNGAGKFNFKIHRPARQYDVEMNRNSEIIKVSEMHFGIGRILTVLHVNLMVGLDDNLLKIWGYYGQLSALFAILAVLTSIYLWFKKSIRHRAELLLVIMSGLFSISYIVFIWLIG